MSLQKVAAALQRAEAVLRRRPEKGLQDDVQAAARWERGTRIVSSHVNGTVIATDLPGELGGDDAAFMPGWLLNAGIASCVATCIAMTAAVEGIELAALEVRVDSRTDIRGALGMEADGERVSPAPRDMRLDVRIAASQASPERLRALVKEGVRRSPVHAAMPGVTPLALHVNVDPAGEKAAR